MNSKRKEQYNNIKQVPASRTMPNSSNGNQTKNEKKQNSAIVVPTGASSIPNIGSSIGTAGLFSNQGETNGEIVVHNHDVLSGRGVHIAHHPGNERFRTLVTSFTDKHYCTSYTVAEKKALAVQIIHHIRSLDPPGRFLKREGKAAASRGLAGPWQVLTERETIKKACQALRDCNRQDRVGYADGVKPPEDVKKIAENLSQSGLSVRERAVAAAVALERNPHSSNTTNTTHHSHNERNPSDARSLSIHTNLDGTQRGVKRTKDEIDKNYYASLSSKGIHVENHFPNFLNANIQQHCHPLTEGRITPSLFYYKNSTNLWGSGRGSVAYPNTFYDRAYYSSVDAYNQYNNGEHSMNPYYNHPYGRTDVLQIDSGFSHSFDHPSNQDLHSDFTNGISNSFNHEPTEQLCQTYTAKQVHHDDSYRDFIPNKVVRRQNLEPTSLMTFEEAWPIKKRRTEEIDPTIGISTSASSPSTPAAIGNNDELAISSSIPTFSDAGFKNAGGSNSLHAVYADIFKADVVDDWENDPITTDCLGGHEAGECVIEDDLNADELFSF